MPGNRKWENNCNRGIPNHHLYLRRIKVGVTRREGEPPGRRLRTRCAHASVTAPSRDALDPGRESDGVGEDCDVLITLDALASIAAGDAAP